VFFTLATLVTLGVVFSLSTHPSLSPRLRTDSLAAPTFSAQWGESINCTEGNPGWCLSDIICSFFYMGNSSSAYFEYSMDGSPWMSYAGPILIAGDGSHFLNVTLYEDGIPSMRTWGYLYIDSVAPESTMDPEAAQALNGWSNVSPVIRLAGHDSYSGLAGLEYRIDDGSWQTYSGPIRLPDGIHPFDYRALDVAGNVEPFHGGVFRVDTASPMIYDLSAHLFHTPDGQVSWHAIDNLSGIAGYALSVDGSAFMSVGMREASNFSLSEGNHEVEIKAFDGAGNVAVLQIPVRVDTNPFSYTGPLQGTPTFLAILVAAILVRLAWWRQKRLTGRG